MKRVRLLGFLLVAICAAAIVAGIAFAQTGAKRPARSPNAGIVVIETALGYQQAEAAGTGMVLTKDGEVLTNNHVIRGATSLRVVVPGSGRSYAATVVGYSLSRDVALLDMQKASGLATVTLGSSAKLKVGQLVRAVGNAGGTGRLTAVRGRVTGLNQAITASDEQGSSERLSSLIQTDAPIRSGDSGGPLLDTSNRVIGMDTAASVSGGNFFFESPRGQGFAIPINRALALVKQIRAGQASLTVHIGGTAFLGVSVSQQTDGFGNAVNGAVVAGIVQGSPADQAGLTEGDQLVAVDGAAVGSPTTLVNSLLRKRPGDPVTLSWLDQTGQQQSQTVTLASGPPQ